MANVKELRDFCEQIYLTNETLLKFRLDKYFETVFLDAHIPWRAVIGNKKCKPIPIYRNFEFYDKNLNPFMYSGYSSSDVKFVWPNMSEHLIRKLLSDLGFVVKWDNISISVPPLKNGQKLTYAQEWVKRINHAYSVYCAHEKNCAKELYEELISDLMNTPQKNIKTCEEYTVFCGYKFEKEVNPVVAKYLRRFMSRDGIHECFENFEYKGIMVKRQTN